MSFQHRAAGILLHPTSLASRGGIGDLGPAAYEFVDFLHAAKQGLWQILPLNPVGLGNSPYSAISAFAGNPLLISVEKLVEHGWLGQNDARSLPPDSGAVDYPEVHAVKGALLRRAAANFLKRPPDALGEHERFERFCKENAAWLEDYVLFAVLRDRHPGVPWNRWPRELAQRQPEALARAAADFKHELQIERILQFAFFEQWKKLHQYCASKGVAIVGDVAIFVNFDSADVWCHPDIFYLDANLEPTVVSGVPPDGFSATGQRWGNPLYRWDTLKSRGYDWWVERLRWATTTCDYVRLDHFRGFDEFWQIPASEPTAIHGRWVEGPRDDLFLRLRQELGDLPFIAEDLGLITPSVVELRHRLGIPGMKVLHFAFSDKGAHIYLPHRYEPHSVAYTGTHDNDTTVGWWQSLADQERRTVRAYLGESADGIHWALIRAAMASPALFSIVPMQDVLGLGGDARMNTPSRLDGNWGWRLRPGMLKRDHAEKLALLAEVTDRDPARKEGS